MRAMQSSVFSCQFSPVLCSRMIADSRYERNMQIKRRRKQQVQKHIFLLILSIFLVCILSLAMGNHLTKASAPNSETYKYYKSIQVSYGDSLWTIADTYMDEHYQSISDYIQEVKLMNCLSSDSVQAGSYIIVPYYSDQFK